MLQNHVGDREFPVRPRGRHARQVQQSRAARLSSISAAEALTRAAPALVLLVVLVALRPALAPHLPPGAQGGYLVLVASLCLLVTAFGVLGGSLRDRSLPVREQRRYRALTGTPDVTARQQQLLALDSQSDFAFGGWNSSLEYVPSWRCLPPQTRQRWEHRDPTGRPLFRTLPLAAVAQQRADIDARHHIASGHDVELYVADLLSTGGASGRFREAVAGPQGDRVLARLASLTGRDEWELRALAEPAGGRPPELLRGADVQWAVSVVRLCYAAEQVDAETAWTLIERAGAAATRLYGSWDEYWVAVRTGVAFGSDSLDVVQRFDADLAALGASAWPAVRVPWLGTPDPPDPAGPASRPGAAPGRRRP